MFYSRLIALCDQNGVKPTPLIKSLGYSAGNIKRWENGATVNSDILLALSKHFKVSVDYLLGRDEQASNDETSFNYTSGEKKHIKKYRCLDEHGKKIIDFCLDEEYDRCISDKEADKPEIVSIRYSYLPASAGTGLDLPEESYKIIDVKANELTMAADFAVKVSGDSMTPTYNDGDILLVVNMPHINVGDIGVFVLNGDGYVKEFGGDKLISHNPEYPDIKLSEYDVVMCSGKVIGVLEKEDFNI